VSDGCDTPLDFATLVDYWLGEMEAADQERAEVHLFACDDCGARLREIVALGAGVRRLAQVGAVQVVVTPSFLEVAERQGLRTREYHVPPGGRVACTVTAEDDLLVSHLEGDFRGVSRLDVVSQLEGGPEQRVEDVPVSPAARELIVAQAMPAMRALGSCVVRMRLFAREAAGERLLAEYTFAHTPANR
jgi:hypothetical protein